MKKSAWLSLLTIIIMKVAIAASAASVEPYLYSAQMQIKDEEGNKNQTYYLANEKTQKVSIVSTPYDNFGNPIDTGDLNWNYRIVSYDPITETWGEEEIEWKGVTLTDTRNITGKYTANISISPNAQPGVFAVHIMFERKVESSLSNYCRYKNSFKPIFIIGTDSVADLTTFKFDGQNTLLAPTMESGSSRFYFESYALDQYRCPSYLPATWSMVDSDGNDVLNVPDSGIKRCITGFWDGCFVIDLSPAVKEGTYFITANASDTSHQFTKTVTIKKEPRYVWGVHMNCYEKPYDFQNKCWKIKSTDEEVKLTISATAEDQYGLDMKLDPSETFIWGLTDAFENVDGVNVKTELNGVSIKQNETDSSIAIVTIPANIETEVWIYAGVKRGEYDFIRYPYLMKITPAYSISIQGEIKDQSGNIVTLKNLNSTEKLCFMVEKKITKIQNGCFFIAFYDEKEKLLHVNSYSTILNKVSTEIEIPISKPVRAVKYIKIFSWSESLSPLCEKIIIDE